MRERYEVMEYPVGISYFAYATARVTHALTGVADVAERTERPTGEFWGDDRGAARDHASSWRCSALAFALAAMLAVWFLAGVNRRRPWDAALFAVSPALLVTGLVNWDLLAVVLVAAALWAWARDRPVLTGVLIGLGMATKLYPLFLLGAILVICLCERRMRDFVRAAAAAAVAWVARQRSRRTSRGRRSGRCSGPSTPSAAPTSARSGWWPRSGPTAPSSRRRSTSGPGCSSAPGASGSSCSACWRPRRRASPSSAFLVVAGFLLVNKVYSPQYVLWLLPLAVLARPRAGATR